MSAGCVLVAHAMDERHPPLVPQLLDGPNAGMQPQLIVQRYDRVVGDPHCGPVVPVQKVIAGNKGVQIVVTACR